MENFNEKYAEIWIEDGIVNVVFTHEHYTKPMIDAAIKYRKEITKDKTYPMLSDIRKIKSSTREARQRLIAKDSIYGTNFVAILINSNFQKIMYNLFKAIFHAPTLAQLFTNKEEAVKWLKEKTKNV